MNTITQKWLDLKMTEEEFQTFRNFIYTRTHISCSDTQKTLFERKVCSRLMALKLPSFQTYYQLLTSQHEGEQEVEQLIDTIAVHETSFFRIHGHFVGLTRNIFPKLIRSATHQTSPDPVRIWSTGCSTGEEPYSIVMTFLELFAAQETLASKTRDIYVTATDISPLIIEKAKQGMYSSKQIQKLEQPLLDKYFICRNNRYHVKQQVKDCVTFDVFNLIDLATVPQNSYDIIFCRNVLIYFARRAQAKLLEELINLLPPGGYLFLGDAESIHTFPESARRLEFIETGNAIIYQKRGG